MQNVFVVQASLSLDENFCMVYKRLANVRNANAIHVLLKAQQRTRLDPLHNQAFRASAIDSSAMNSSRSERRIIGGGER